MVDDVVLPYLVHISTLMQEDTLGGLVVKAKCAPLIGTIETTLLGSAAAAEALAERAEYAADEADTSDLALTGIVWWWRAFLCQWISMLRLCCCI